MLDKESVREIAARYADEVRKTLAPHLFYFRQQSLSVHNAFLCMGLELYLLHTAFQFRVIHGGWQRKGLAGQGLLILQAGIADVGGRNAVGPGQLIHHLAGGQALTAHGQIEVRPFAGAARISALFSFACRMFLCRRRSCCFRLFCKVFALLV